MLALCESEADFAEYDRIEAEVIARTAAESQQLDQLCFEGTALVAKNQEVTAGVLGIEVRTLQRWMKKGCPGGNKHYVLREIIQWARENAWSEDAVIIEGATGEPNNIQTQYLKERIEKIRRENKLADFKIETQAERLVDLDHVQQILNRQADVFRNGLERFERKFGAEPTTVILELLEEVEKVDFSTPTE